MSTQVQALTIAMFGAYAGGYTAEIQARVDASGLAGAANSLVGFQQPLLGLNLSSNSTWIDVLLGNLGISSTNAAYAEAAAWASDQLADGASRGDVVAAAVSYLLGDTVAPAFQAVADAFVANVEAGVAYSEGEGADVVGIADLRDAAGNTGSATDFNLTAALAELTAAEKAVADFVEAWGEENEVEDATELNITDVLDGVETTLGIAGLTAAQKSAAIATEQANLDADLVDANKTLTAETKDVNAVSGLKLAVDRFATAFKAAQDADKAADAAQLALDEAEIGGNTVLAGLPGSLATVDTYATDPLASPDGTIKIDVKAADFVALGLSSAQANTAITSINNYVSKFNADVAADKALADAVAVAETRLQTIDDLDPGTGLPFVATLLVDPSQKVSDHLDGITFDYAIALEDVAAAQKALADFAELLADYNAAKADVDALTALTDVVDDVIANIQENGFFVNVAEDGDVFNTLDETEADVFLLSGLEGGDVVEIANFGLQDKDLLVFGDTAFQLVKLEKAINTDVGSATAFEIFWEEDAGSLFLYVETKVFAGNLLNTDEVYTVELIGFSAADIGSFSGNLLSA